METELTTISMDLLKKATRDLRWALTNSDSRPHEAWSRVGGIEAALSIFLVGAELEAMKRKSGVEQLRSSLKSKKP